MRKAIMMLRTLLIATVIIISGSAVGQTWHCAQEVEFEENCTDENEILYEPNGSSASIGKSNPDVLGRILVDLGEGNAMGANQNFTVFGGSLLNLYKEEYDVWVSEDSETIDYEDYCGRGDDREYEEFQTPSDLEKEWRYIYIHAVLGDPDGGGPAFGPDIDAVGWYEP
jgi:hypothetical protein